MANVEVQEVRRHLVGRRPLVATCTQVTAPPLPVGTAMQEAIAT